VTRGLRLRSGERSVVTVVPGRSLEETGMQWQLSARILGSSDVVDPAGDQFAEFETARHGVTASPNNT
jgi:hypothetical protein